MEIQDFKTEMVLKCLYNGISKNAISNEYYSAACWLCCNVITKLKQRTRNLSVDNPQHLLHHEIRFSCMIIICTHVPICYKASLNAMNRSAMGRMKGQKATSWKWAVDLFTLRSFKHACQASHQHYDMQQ